MARRTKRPPVTRRIHLRPERRTCSTCGGSLWAAYENYRTVTTLDAVCRLTLTIARCHNPQCPRFRMSYRVLFSNLVTKVFSTFVTILPSSL